MYTKGVYKLGTIIMMKQVYTSLIKFPECWPVKSNQEHDKFVHKQKDLVLILTFCNEGNIHIKIISHQTTMTYTSQVIEFSNAKRAIISICWEDTIFKVLINGEELKNSNDKSIFIIDSKPELNIPLPSLDSTMVKEGCKKWTEWRKDKFLNKKKEPKKGRRLVSIEEEITSLSTAIKDLNQILQSRELIDSNSLQSIFPILRSLLFWTNGKKSNYNPLLYRLAGKLSLSLPIYAFPNDHPFNNNNHHLLLTYNHASLTKQFPSQVIMDFQEWLNSNLIIERDDTPFILKDLIIEGANTRSYGHFDEDVPIKLDILNDSQFKNFPIILSIIGHVSEITIHYGNIIISRYKNTKIPNKSA